MILSICFPIVKIEYSERDQALKYEDCIRLAEEKEMEEAKKLENLVKSTKKLNTNNETICDEEKITDTKDNLEIKELLGLEKQLDKNSTSEIKIDEVNNKKNHHKQSFDVGVHTGTKANENLENKLFIKKRCSGDMKNVIKDTKNLLKGFGCKYCNGMRVVMERTSIDPHFLGTRKNDTYDHSNSNEHVECITQEEDICSKDNETYLNKLLDEAKCIYLCGSTVANHLDYVIYITSKIKGNKLVFSVQKDFDLFNTQPDLLKHIISKCRVVIGVPKSFEITNVNLLGSAYTTAIAMGKHQTFLNKAFIFMEAEKQNKCYESSTSILTYSGEGVRNVNFIGNDDDYVSAGFISYYYGKNRNLLSSIDVGFYWAYHFSGERKKCGCCYIAPPDPVYLREKKY